MIRPITNNLTFLALLLLFSLGSKAQIQVQSSFSACPNQVTTVTPVWNNVSNITYSLTIQGNSAVQVGPSFTISSALVGTIAYTVTGVGNALSGTVTSSANFNLVTFAAAPLSVTQAPSSFGGNYCFGSSASFTVPIGAANYAVSGGCAGNMNSLSNIITIPNLNAGCAGIYTIAATINGCARTGTTQVNVAPNHQLTVSSPTAFCENVNYNYAFTSALTSGTDYGWIGPGGSAVNGVLSGPASQSWSGIYTATANIFYNGVIKCPRSATTTVSVIQTSQVSAAASPNNIICQGQNVTLNATAPGAQGFIWNGPQSFFSTSQNPQLTQVIPAGNNGNYSVTALFLGNNLTCSTSAQVNLQVVPVSQPVITMPSSVCENTNQVVMNVTAGPGASISWNGPCLNVIGYNNILQNPGTSCSGIYYATAVYAIGSIQCPATASAALNVIPVNTITVVPPTPVCSPDNGFLQASAPGANGFSWVGPQNFFSPGANVTVYNPTPANSGIYTVTATFGGGNISCSKTNTVQLTINPVLNFSLAQVPVTCYNTSITVAGPAGASGYTWTSSNGYYSNTQNMLLPSAQPKHSGSYTLTVALGPCITNASTDVLILEPLTFSLVPQNKSVCLGDTVLLEGRAAGGSQNYSYVWQPPVYMDSPNGPTKLIIPKGSVQYNLMVHDIACPNYSISTPMILTVGRPPEPDLQLSPGQGCAPLTMLYNTKASDAAIVTFDWGENIIEQGDNQYYTLSKPGTYNLKMYMKGKNGCGGNYDYPFPITVFPSPGTDFYVSPEKPTTQDKVTFVPVSSYSNIVRYSWSFMGGTNLLDTSTVKSATASAGADTSNILNPFRQYNQPGGYPVMLITENDYGCVDTTYKVINIIDDLNIYIPNTFTPNGDNINDVFYVKGVGIKDENFSMEIIDRWGISVFRSRNILEGWDGTYKGAPAKDGTYSVVVKAVGLNGEGRKQITTYVNLIK